MIRETYDQHLSYVFEDICKERCLELMREDRISFTSIGRWWHRNEEIDIVALDEEKREIYLGEAKWSKKPVGTDILEDLRRKAPLVEWNSGKRKDRFMLFSRSGFTDALKEKARKEDVLLISVLDN